MKGKASMGQGTHVMRTLTYSLPNMSAARAKWLVENWDKVMLASLGMKYCDFLNVEGIFGTPITLGVNPKELLIRLAAGGHFGRNAEPAEGAHGLLQMPGVVSGEIPGRSHADGATHFEDLLYVQFPGGNNIRQLYMQLQTIGYRLVTICEYLQFIKAWSTSDKFPEGRLVIFDPKVTDGGDVVKPLISMTSPRKMVRLSWAEPEMSTFDAPWQDVHTLITRDHSNPTNN